MHPVKGPLSNQQYPTLSCTAVGRQQLSLLQLLKVVERYIDKRR